MSQWQVHHSCWTAQPSAWHMVYVPFQEIHYSHHLFLTLSKRGLYSIFILATTHSYSHSFHFLFPWPYLDPTTSLVWDRGKAGKRSESAVSEQHRSISQRWWGYSPQCQTWMSLRPPKRLVGKLFQMPETESLGKATPQIKHLGGKNTHTQLPCPSAEMQPSIQGTALSHIPGFLSEKPTAFSKAKSNTPELIVALTRVTFSLMKEAHSCKILCWLKPTHSTLQCIVALLFICFLIGRTCQQE